MSTQVERAHGLEALGIVRSGRVHWNLSPAVLYEIAVRRNEAILAADGPLVARTGQHTGRSPQDKFTVKEPTTEQNIHWAMNKPVSEAYFDALHRDMMTYIQDKELFVLDAWGGADPAYRVPSASSPSSRGTTCLRETCSSPSWIPTNVRRIAPSTR
jgi:phosphoenolpyruvate carboxykinase (ATP)